MVVVSEVVRKTKVRAAVVAVLLPVIGGLSAGPAAAAPAGEPPGGTVGYQRQRVVCSNPGDSVTIGGAVRMQEFGKRGVNQFRVEWLLYDVDPNKHAVVSAKRRRTFQSSTVPNDSKNYFWANNFQQWQVGPASDEGWWLIAKMTWVRPGARDWNYKLPVARCG